MAGRSLDHVTRCKVQRLVLNMSCYFYCRALLAGIMTTAIAAAPGLADRSMLERSPISNSFYLSQRIQFQPPDRGAPPATVGAGSRGTSLNIPVTVLVPTAADERFSLTTDETPILWVHVIPHTDAAPQSTELVLHLYGTDPQTQEPLFTRQTFATPTTAGLIAMPLLPDDADPLLLDTPYEWVLSIQDENELAYSELASGWIERAAPADDLMTQLETSDGLETVALYAEAGLWHDMIDALIKLQQTTGDPAITEAWDTVLSDVGLDAIAIEPVLPCCLPAPPSDSEAPESETLSMPTSP